MLSWIVITSTAIANSVVEKKIIQYQRSILAKNPGIKVKSIEVTDSQPISQGSQWRAYTLSMELVYRGRDLSLNDFVFSDGNLVSADFFDLDTINSIKSRFTPKIVDKYYDDDHFVVGNPKANHKIAVFSDPLCPYCQRTIPELIEFTLDNKERVALYYFHFPLISIHPTAGYISKILFVAQERGMDREEIYKKLYEAQAQ